MIPYSGAKGIRLTVDPRDRLRSLGKRMTDPMESLAQRIAEGVFDLLVDAWT
jgi:hypothetical protein